MDRTAIAERLEANRIPCGPDTAERIEIYLRVLQEWNKRMDLTAVEGEEEMLDKHFIDSLTALKTGLIPEEGTLIDVGTGAGFPGMVLALVREKLQVTLLDSQRKRLTFLEEVIRKTGAKNVKLIHARAEDGGRLPELREKYDVAAARAVASLPVLCELLLPYVRIGGKALCWKGPGLRDEAEAGRKAAFLLGGKTGEPILCPVEGREWEHLILPVEKKNKTPASYPRKAGIPKGKPLGE